MEKADLQIGCDAGETPGQQAVGHGSVQQSGDDTSMQQAGVAGIFLRTRKAALDGSGLIRPEIHCQSVLIGKRADPAIRMVT